MIGQSIGRIRHETKHGNSTKSSAQSKGVTQTCTRQTSSKAALQSKKRLSKDRMYIAGSGPCLHMFGRKFSLSSRRKRKAHGRLKPTLRSKVRMEVRSTTEARVYFTSRKAYDRLKTTSRSKVRMDVRSTKDARVYIQELCTFLYAHVVRFPICLSGDRATRWSILVLGNQKDIGHLQKAKRPSRVAPTISLTPQMVTPSTRRDSCQGKPCARKRR